MVDRGSSAGWTGLGYAVLDGVIIGVGLPEGTFLHMCGVTNLTPPWREFPPVGALYLLLHLVHVLVPPLLGLGLHPALALWLVFPSLRPGGGHLPELVGCMVRALPLLGLGLHPSLALWLVFPPVHPGGGHLPELGHGGQGQQCWTDWAWVCIAGWCYHWSGASCGEASPQQTPHPPVPRPVCLVELDLHLQVLAGVAPCLLGECWEVLVGGVIVALSLRELFLHPVCVH